MAEAVPIILSAGFPSGAAACADPAADAVLGEALLPVVLELAPEGGVLLLSDMLLTCCSK